MRITSGWNTTTQVVPWGSYESVAPGSPLAPNHVLTPATRDAGEQDSADSDIDRTSEEESDIDGEAAEKVLAKQAKAEKVPPPDRHRSLVFLPCPPSSGASGALFLMPAIQCPGEREGQIGVPGPW